MGSWKQKLWLKITCARHRPKNYVKSRIWEFSGLKTRFFAKKTLKSRDVCYCLQIIWKFAQFCKQPTVFAEKTCALAYALWLSFVPCCCCETQLFVINRTVGKKIKPAWLWKLVFSGRITKCQNSWKIGYFWRDFVTTYSTRPWHENQSPNRFLGFVKVLRILLFFVTKHHHDQIKR